MRHFYCFILTLLFFLTACTPSHSLSLSRQSEAVSWTRKLNNQPLGQTLIVPKEGLSEIELLLALPPSAPKLVSRPLRWQIVDNSEEILRAGILETKDYLPNTPLRLRFERLSGPQQIELLLKGPQNAEMKLWRSRADLYADGLLLDNQPERQVDLAFTLRVEETPIDLFGAIKTAAERWLGVGKWSPSWPAILESWWDPSWPSLPSSVIFEWLWVPLLLIAPGWLFGWLLGTPDSRPIVPIAPAAAGLSLALMPFLYLWGTLLGVSLYEPFVSSLFYISSMLLLLLMLHNRQSRRAIWQSAWRRPLGVLGLFIIAGIATWLLAGRALLAPPGELSLDAGLLAQDMLNIGSVRALSSAFAPAALTFTLARMSRQAVPLMSLLSALILGVATIPSLYALAAEITTRSRLFVNKKEQLNVSQKPPSISEAESKIKSEAWVALWLVPFAWLWPAAWQALANGDLLVLYNLVLLPITVTLGLRALRATTRVWQALLLAALPLSALILVQGGAVVAVWAITILVSAYKQAQTRQSRKDDLRVERRMSNALRALLWLIVAGILWLPAGFKGASLTPFLPVNMMGYDWLLLIILFALIAGWLGNRLGKKIHLVTILVLLSLPLLLWWRSSPIETSQHVLSQQEIDGLIWAGMGTNPETLFLINLNVRGEKVEATDGGLWIPLYGEHDTVLQRDIAPDLLAQAMQLERLNDPTFRQTLQEAGITHIYVNTYSSGPLHAKDLLNQTWAHLIHQSGPIYIFEFITTPPEPVGNVETRQNW